MNCKSNIFVRRVGYALLPFRSGYKCLKYCEPYAEQQPQNGNTWQDLDGRQYPSDGVAEGSVLAAEQ